MKVLVTGATGFIGSHLVEKLVDKGYDVKALVRSKETGKTKEESLNLLKNLNVKIIYGDLLELDSLKKAVKDVDRVFHLAAIARPMKIPDKLYFEVNEQGTRNLLNACMKNKKIKKIIIMSSISAVGPTRNGNPVNEKTGCKPEETYGWSKLAQERVAIKYFEKYKLPIVLLRPPMVFGPRDYEMLRLFRVINTRFFPIDGKEKGIEFLYVKNLVDVCLLTMKNGKNGEKYHISNGEHYSINDIVKAISKSEKKKILPIKFPNVVFVGGGYIFEILGNFFNFHPPFKHDTCKWMTKKVWYSDISKAKRELKYSPKFSLEKGVKETVKYYKEKGLI